MYRLMVSHNCGASYSADLAAETPDELMPRMIELDDDGFRWYLTKDGADVPGYACRIRRNILTAWEAQVRRDNE